jgi:hypothetical protein
MGMKNKIKIGIIFITWCEVTSHPFWIFDQEYLKIFEYFMNFNEYFLNNDIKWCWHDVTWHVKQCKNPPWCEFWPPYLNYIV